MAAPVEPPHVHHPVGHRGLDLVVPVVALFVSLVSILIAWYSATVEAQMAQQNERMVQATSLPYMELYVNNGSDHITFLVTNAGVGPALIRSAVVLIDGHPVRTLKEILEACCGTSDRSNVTKSNLQGQMVRPGDRVNYVDAQPGSNVVAGLTQLLRQSRMETRICYCSVFNDCWVRSDRDVGEAIAPRPVKSCPIGSYHYKD